MEISNKMPALLGLNKKQETGRSRIKLFSLFVVSFFISVEANAKDACSDQVIGYISGLETVVSLPVIEKNQRDKVLKQMEYIKKLQESLPDCEVVGFIPELKATKNALKFATEQINK
ncbi:hypothetical protein [Pseudoalteromonas sp. GutCa3]|uniref:hypothetical protein n=1 Tax=Pseudoalteromonas sp. GutCa3 TaxID=888433 RepID=UPI000C31DA73|nr:hypothetical protein [Pseudoalteromonas sp. GutCa3]PKG68638.1 hypothetical protein CXF64_20155 [Pseudoalteromonas sp. GutCa3]